MNDLSGLPLRLRRLLPTRDASSRCANLLFPLGACVFLFAFAAGAAEPAGAGDSPQYDAVAAEARLRAIGDPALRILRGLGPEARAKLLAGERAGALPVPADGRIGVLLRFAADPAERELADCRAAGLEFDLLPGGGLARVGTIYSGRIVPERLAGLAAIPSIEQLDAQWRPAMRPPLDLSCPEVQADQVWAEVDGGQRPIRGQGVVIADLDTGVDVFHPGFFRDDGGTFSWVDANQNGQFDPGTDGVDLDGNGSVGAGETLRFLDGAVYDDPLHVGTLFENGVYDTDRDWLYNDANGDGSRTFGRAAGFTDASPCFGEPFFLTVDANQNTRLDPGESLVMLKTSKVKAVYNPKTEQVWARGTNLIDCEPDLNGHGTGVCGILVQDTPGRGRKLVGLAPDADIVVANIFSGIDIGSEAQLTKVMGWAQNQGAKILLWEIGSITFDYADGSSIWEQAVNQSAASGTVQVCPAGNYGGSGKHASADLAAGANVDLPLKIPTAAEDPYHQDITYVFASVVWTGDAGEMALEVRTPGGTAVSVPAGQQEGYLPLGTEGTLYYVRGQSPRGTAAIFLMLYKGQQGGEVLPTGVWHVKTTNQATLPRHVGFWSLDDVSSWAYGAVWEMGMDDASCIDIPATADSAIAVASYSTRGYLVGVGDLSTFSGRGPRVDGAEVMDIAAPGNYDVYSARSKDVFGGALGTYWAFGGTSAAGPHVAAVSALLLQGAPAAGHTAVARALRAGAASDFATGAVPNESWGAGKMRARQSLDAIGGGGGGGGGTPGDANVDGSVNVLDLVAIVNHILEITLLSGSGLQNADVNHDAQISILDVVGAVNIILNGKWAGGLAERPWNDATGSEVGAKSASASPEGMSIDLAWQGGGPAAIDIVLRSAPPGGLVAGPIGATCGGGGADWQAMANVLPDGTIRVIAFRTGGHLARESGATSARSGAASGGSLRIGLPLRGSPAEVDWVGGEAVTLGGVSRPINEVAGFPLQVDPATAEGESQVFAGPLRIVPNPSRGETAILLGRGDRSAAAAGEIRVCDVTGAIVRVLRAGAGGIAGSVAGSVAGSGAGSDRVLWDGCDARGRTLPSGVYFAREVAADGRQGRSARIFLLR